MGLRTQTLHPILTAETHNFPTYVCRMIRKYMFTVINYISLNIQGSSFTSVSCFVISFLCLFYLFFFSLFYLLSFSLSFYIFFTICFIIIFLFLFSLYFFFSSFSSLYFFSSFFFFFFIIFFFFLFSEVLHLSQGQKRGQAAAWEMWWPPVEEPTHVQGWESPFLGIL